MTVTTDLSPGERLWFEQEGVPLDDPRVTAVRRRVDGGQVIEFQVAGATGPAYVRFEAPDERDSGPAWVIAEGPAVLQGRRYEDVGEAVQAALAGRS